MSVYFTVLVNKRKSVKVFEDIHKALVEEGLEIYRERRFDTTKEQMEFYATRNHVSLRRGGKDKISFGHNSSLDWYKADDRCKHFIEI